MSVYAHGGDFYTDSGVASTYVLSVIGAKVSTAVYFDGMRVRFEVGAANTGASTVNVAGIGVIDIRTEGGGVMPAGRLSGVVELVYRNTAGFFVLANVTGGTKPYNSVAEAVAGQEPVGSVVSLTSYILDEGFGGGDFVVVPMATGTDDGGSFIDRTDGAQLKALDWRGEVHLARFGLTPGVDSTPFLQKAIDFCAATGYAMLSEPGRTYRFDGNAFFHGDFDIQGTAESSVWEMNLLNGVGADSNIYHFVFGVTGFNEAATPYNGTITGIKWKTTAAADFNRLLFVLSSERFKIINVHWDFLDTTFTTLASGGPIESGANGAWTTGGTSVWGTCKILNSRADLVHGFEASEGIAMAEFDLLIIDSCEVYGAGDDIYAAHKCKEVYITNNKGTGVDGRILIDHAKVYKVDSNIITRIIDPDDGMWHAGSFINTLMSSSDNAQPANERGEITNNTLIAPANSLTNYFIRCQACQMSLLVGNNDMVNESALGINNGITIEITNKAGWTGPPGNPDEANGGTVRVRDVKIIDNKMSGSVKDMPIDMQGTSIQFLGPLVFSGNTAGSFGVFTDVTTFTATNKANSADGVIDVVHSACVDAVAEVFTFTGLDNAFTTGAPLSGLSPALVCRADRQTRIMGYYLDRDVLGTSGHTMSTRILVNGSPITTDADGVSINTHNERSYRTQAGFEVAAGDRIEVEFFCSGGQLVPLEGNLSLILQPY